MGSIFPDPPQFERYDHIPAGCRLMMVRDDKHDPYLRQGEFAVIKDPASATATFWTERRPRPEPKEERGRTSRRSAADWRRPPRPLPCPARSR